MGLVLMMMVLSGQKVLKVLRLSRNGFSGSVESSQVCEQLPKNPVSYKNKLEYDKVQRVRTASSIVGMVAVPVMQQRRWYI